MNSRARTSARAFRALSLGLVFASARDAAAQLAGVAGLGASVPAQLGPLVIEGGATANRIGSSVSPRTTLDVSSSLSFLVKDGGFWLGASEFRAKEVDSLPVRPLVNAGLWHEFSKVTLSLGAQSHVAQLGGRGPKVVTVRVPVPGQLVTVPDSGNGHSQTVQSYRDSTYGDSGVASQRKAWSDLEASASWWAGRVRFGTVVGARPAVGTANMAVWGRVSAETQLASRLTLSAGVGVQPAELAIGVPSSRFATIGLHVATWRRGMAPERAKAAATSFVIRKLDASRYRIEYHVSGAHRVEVSGDFDNWTPIELNEVSPGQWQASVSVGPGTYHMNVRVDGGRWNAPPGSVEVADDFNGTVGIVVVR